MDNQLVTTQPDAQMMESVLLGGDLSKLNPSQRVSYYQKVCESVGLNPLTKPFGYITLNGKLVLYALKDAAEQLRANRRVSITQLEKQFSDDLYIVTAHAQTPDGRTDASTGVVTIGGLKGDAKANALMKAETKAKRRVTLSICGMGFLDESEISSIPNARPVIVTEEGEISDEQPASLQSDEQPAIELIKPLSEWAVKQAAKTWNMSDSDTAKEIARAALSPMTRDEFTDWLASKS